MDQDSGNGRKLPDLITVFAEMDPHTLITPEWMARTMGRHVYSIDRAIERGDFPVPSAFLNTRVWTPAALIQYINETIARQTEEALNKRKNVTSLPKRRS